MKANTKRVELRKIRRIGRHVRIRKAIVGTAERPRLCVYRSLKNFYAQIIDDTKGRVLFGASTTDKKVRAKFKTAGNINAATALGEVLATLAKSKGVSKVCFDRGGYLYHGRVKAFADAARKGGLEF